MDKDALVGLMTTLLVDAVEAEDEDHGLDLTPSAPLVGGEAVMSSMSLVSFIMDIEAELEAQHDLQVTLVNESALSREKSPFRTVDTLADYVMELAGESTVATS